MSNKNGIGYRGDETITFFGERSSNPLLFQFERRKDEKAAILEGGLEFGAQVHASDASRRYPDNGLPPAQQYAEALLLHRRMEPTRQDPSVIAPGSHKIESLQNHATRALRGTEESRLMVPQDFDLSGGPDGVNRCICNALLYPYDLFFENQCYRLILVCSIRAEAVLDVVVDDEIEFFVSETVMASKSFVDFVD